MTIHFRSFGDLQSEIYRNLHKIPNDVDLVVGVPRSGMMAGSLVALALNLPLSDVDSFAQNRAFSKGSTRSDPKTEHFPPKFRHALIVDDSCRTGAAMEAVRARLAATDIEKITYCVIYGMPEQNRNVDLALATVPVPRIFEWNVLHHPILREACVDIDGVLCHDPTPEQNDDGEAYTEFLRSALSLHRPSHKIGALVTSRLEKYRPETKEWLRIQGINYDQLIMLDLPDAKTRRKLSAHATFKAAYYKKSEFTFFIESEHWQAVDIANISGKPVLWIGGPQMIYPGTVKYDHKEKNWKRSGFRSFARDMLGQKNWELLRRLARKV